MKNFFRAVAIQNLSVDLEDKRLQSFGHVERMDRTTKPRKKYEFTFKGKRLMGRNRT
jgi:hypothetical protein